MRAKQKLRVCVDALMTCALLLRVGYSMVGETAHEWLGVGMFALFVTHRSQNDFMKRDYCASPFNTPQIISG